MTALTCESAVRLAYNALIGRLTETEPRYGYVAVTQLPELTDEDLRTVIAAEPDVVADALADPGVAAVVREHLLRTVDLAGDTLSRNLRFLLIGVLRHEARKVLLGDVQQECTLRAADGAGWRERLAAARDAGVAAVGEIP